MADRSRYEKIREATLKAIDRHAKLVDSALQDLYDDYGRAADAIAAMIADRAGGDGQLALTQLPEVLADVRKEMDSLGQQRDKKLYRSIDESAALGCQPFQGAIPSSQLFGINHQAVAFVRNFAGADGLQLSERLWRIDRGAARVLTDHIQFAVINGESAHQAAMRAMNAGQDVPRHLTQAMDAAKANTLGRSVRGLMTGQPDPVSGKGIVYQAERVFRTEINRAHGEAYMSAAFQTEGVVGVRFRLSPRHPKCDICDTHATADLYGLGEGVYPDRASCPWPAHPNTLSYLEAVFEDELEDQKSRAKAAPPRSTPTAPPGSLDHMIELGRARGDKLLEGGIDREYLPRLHQQLNEERSTGTAAAVASRGAGADLVQAASRLFPDDWTRAADDLGPLYAKAHAGRGFQITLYNPGRQVRLPLFGLQRDLEPGAGFIAAGNFQTAVHEYAHRLQHAIPDLDDYFQQLHLRRTAGMPAKSLRELTGNQGYRATEVAQEDHYLTPYQGRVYSGPGLSYTGRTGALEVMTLAFEDVLSGNPVRLQRMVENDREMFDLVMGLLFNYVPR